MASRGLRLSPQQRQVWGKMTTSGGAPFVAQVAVELGSAVEPATLERRLREAVGRHEILRTRFPRRVGFKEPLQVVADGVEVDWRRAEVDGPAPSLEDLLSRERSEGFDVEQAPLVRALLAREGEGRRVLVLTASALVADGESLARLVEEVVPEAGRAPDPDPVQYFEFAEWQHGLLEDEEAEEAARFWAARLAPEWQALQLPGRHPGDGAREYRPQVAGHCLEAAEADRVERLADELGTSAGTLLLTCWLALLARLGGRADPATGYLASARDAEELEGALGAMSRPVPVAVPRVAEVPLGEAVHRVASAVEESTTWKEYWLAPSRDDDPAPVVGFSFQQWPRWSARQGCSAATVLASSVCCDRFAAELAAWRQAGALHLDLRFDPSRLDRAEAERLLGRFGRLLHGLLGESEPASAVLGSIDLLDERERQHLLVELNRTERSDFPLDRPVHELFLDQVRATPDAPAVIDGEHETTYRELLDRARAIGRRLVAAGVGPESVVALVLPRSAELVASVLGVLEAGAAFLPLDPDDPEERLAGILEDADPAAVLTDESLAGRLPEAARSRALFPLAVSGAEAEEPPAGAAPEPDQLAYVIFTSGSTGRPKGVAVPHRGLVSYLCWCRETYPVASGSRVPLHSSVAFDLGLTALLLPLVTGGAIEIVSDENGLEALGAAMDRSADGGPGTDLVKVTPSHLEVLAATRTWSESGGPAAMIVGGEALDGERLAFWRRRRPSLRVFNEYGPTETVVGCVLFELPAGEPAPGPVPIGMPVANARIYVLDEGMRPVPEGLPGELFIGGVGVARGYLGRPAMTAERFVPDPYGEGPGGRLYRSGDVGAHLPSGALRYLGRNDDQVKIRGVRVEPGEVAAVLRAHPEVGDAVVVAPVAGDGARRLIAYAVCPAQLRPSAADLRDFLADRLTEAMVPSHVVVLDALPLTAAGKLDRRALPDPGSERLRNGGRYVAPRTRTERVLAEIFAETLELDRVGVEDSFFGLGGDSIRCVRVVALAREQGLELTVPDMFRFQTAAELAARIGESEPSNAAEDEADLAELLDELEGLSNEEARQRLQGHEAGSGSDG